MRESVDESKMHTMVFLLIKRSTKSTFEIHFQIGGCLTEKTPPLAQSDMPGEITDVY